MLPDVVEGFPLGHRPVLRVAALRERRASPSAVALGAALLGLLFLFTIRRSVAAKIDK